MHDSKKVKVQNFCQPICKCFSKTVTGFLFVSLHHQCYNQLYCSAVTKTSTFSMANKIGCSFFSFILIFFSYALYLLSIYIVENSKFVLFFFIELILSKRINQCIPWNSSNNYKKLFYQFHKTFTSNHFSILTKCCISFFLTMNKF